MSRYVILILFCLFRPCQNLSTCECDVPRERHIDDSEKWLSATNSNQARVQEAILKMKSEKIESYDIVFYGDSITEDWTGTRFGKPDARHTKTLDVFNSFFSSSHGGSYEGLAFGIAGDTGPNLIWRLRNGEMPSSLRSKVWWILIGTNDLSREQCTVDDVIAIVEEVLMEVLDHAQPSEKVIINGLLPRFDDEELTFWDQIQDINKSIQKICDEKKESGLNVEYFEENYVFFKEVKDETVFNEDVMPDKLHPNSFGHELWARKIVAKLDSFWNA